MSSGAIIVLLALAYLAHTLIFSKRINSTDFERPHRVRISYLKRFFHGVWHTLGSGFHMRKEGRQ